MIQRVTEKTDYKLFFKLGVIVDIDIPLSFANIQKIYFPPNKFDEKYHKSIKKHKHSPTLFYKV